MPLWGNSNMNLQQIIDQRAKTHGKFEDNAVVATEVMASLAGGANFQSLTTQQFFALQNIAGKMARIVNGDANEPDHWTDIAGYATLAKECNEQDKQAFEDEVIMVEMPENKVFKESARTPLAYTRACDKPK